MVGNSDYETNVPHKLLLTNRQVANIRNSFASYLSTDIKLSKTQLSKMVHSGGFLNFLVVSDLRSETKGSRFDSGCYLCAEVSSLQ